MTVLPAAGALASTISVSDAEVALPALLESVREMPGGSAVTTLTIAGGVITPTACRHLVDTESAAATDNLDNVALTNVAAGRLLILSIVNSARVVTIRHARGGLGQFLLSPGADYVLSDTSQRIILERIGNDIVEVGRWYGSNITAFAALLGLGTAAFLNSNDPAFQSGARKISTGVFSGSTDHLDFTGLTGFNHYWFELVDVLPNNSEALFQLQASADNGATWLTGVGDWSILSQSTESGTVGVAAGITLNYVLLIAGGQVASALGTQTFGVSGRLDLYRKPGNNPSVQSNLVWRRNNGHIWSNRTEGKFRTLSTINAVRFTGTAGNFQSGEIELWGG
jgi:hypothetical protein